MNPFSFDNYGNNDRLPGVNFPSDWEKLGVLTLGDVATAGTVKGTIDSLNGVVQLLAVPRGTQAAASGNDCHLVWWQRPDGKDLSNEQGSFVISKGTGIFSGPSFPIIGFSRGVTLGIVNTHATSIVATAYIDVYARSG